MHFGDSPQQAWANVYAADGGGSVCHTGVQLCGFKEPEFRRLLHIASSAALREFDHHKEISKLKDRRLRALRAAAGEAFVSALISRQ